MNFMYQQYYCYDDIIMPRQFIYVKTQHTLKSTFNITIVFMLRHNIHVIMLT